MKLPLYDDHTRKHLLFSYNAVGMPPAKNLVQAIRTFHERMTKPINFPQLISSLSKELDVPECQLYFYAGLMFGFGIAPSLQKEIQKIRTHPLQS